MKVDVLKIVCLMTTGYKYFVNGQIPKYNQDSDCVLGQRLADKLGNYSFVVQIQQQVKSRCVEVMDMAYLAMGTYLKNGIDISQLFLDQNTFFAMYGQLSDSTGLQTLKYSVWSLFIYTLKCFRPGQTESLQLMASVQQTVSKLVEILQLQSIQDEMLLQVTLLSLGNVLHLHPPTEVTLQFFNYISEVLIQGLHSPQLLRVALRCVH